MCEKMSSSSDDEIIVYWKRAKKFTCNEAVAKIIRSTASSIYGSSFDPFTEPHSIPTFFFPILLANLYLDRYRMIKKMNVFGEFDCIQRKKGEVKQLRPKLAIVKLNQLVLKEGICPCHDETCHKWFQ